MEPPRRVGTPDRSPAEAVELVLRLLVGIVALAFVAAAGYAGLVRLTFPFPIEWMEGGVVLHVRRVLYGQPLYVRPSLEFTPFIYPPLYYYVAAGVAAVTGLGFLPARLVSLLSALGCLAVIWYLVRRETEIRAPAAAAAGLFASAYPLVGTWFDLARVDMLFLFLSLLVLPVVRFGRRPRAAVAAGVLFALAYLTKQSALVVLGPVVLWALWYQRRFGYVFAGVAGGLVVASTAWLHVSTDGWFLYYLLSLPTRHSMVPARVVGFWTRDLLPPVLVAAAFAAAYVAIALRPGASERARFYLLAVGGLVAASWQARIHHGGWINTLLPAYAGLAILFGLGLHRALATAPHIADRAPGAPGAVRALVLALVLLQFASLGYAPTDHVPTADDRRQGQETVRAIEAMEGPVYSPVFPYVAMRAGAPPVAHKVAVVDVLRASPHDARSRLRADISRAMRSHRYATLLFHSRELPLWPVNHSYRYVRPFSPPDDRWVPMTGVPKHPRYAWTAGDTPKNATRQRPPEGLA